MVNALSYPFTAMLVALHWKRIAYVATRNIPLLIFIGTAIFSFVWSTDLNSTLNISRGLLRTFMFGAYFAARYSLKEQMKILAWVFGISAILTLAVCLVIPGYGIGSSGWTGIFPYKNFMGRAMILGAILFLIIALNKHQWRQNWLGWIGFGLTVPLAILAKSSTSLLLFLILLSQMPLYWMVKQKYKLRVVFLSFVCIVIGAVAILIVANQETILVDALGEGTTFNGRTPIWTLIIERVSEERPWLGYGYGAFWTSDAGVYVILNTWASLDGFRSNFNAHSGYMELFANLGFLGLILYGIVLVSVCTKAIVLLLSTRKVEFFWLFQFLVFVVLASLADVGIGMSATNAYGVISIAACLSISVEYKRLKKGQYFENAFDSSNITMLKNDSF
jgi:O-antigen ligase